MNLFQEDLINFQPKTENWETALATGIQPLLAKNYVSKDYLNHLISETKRFGAYYVIGPDLALAHIQPNETTLKTGISLLYLDEPTLFPGLKMKPVKFLFVLVATDSDSHLSLLQEMALLFSKKEFYDAFYQLKDTTDLFNLVNKFKN
ncbi:PTS system ascorbate-specific IIA component [Entomoplasma freundtii]|uniref:Ascorbate-specific PTS system EIIA component n=1 Tax=Entomoplasma freundtii TaxID=74700 RepID=A0A2K8NR40_9MOLU|nr:PTS sugar transporter subunit IIA [Entomoplasma freundtii]ATZ16302.1 PTS system, ascorbate-specific IIA component [Entomoplasma freundtii]TDY56796.1 PTS system ascorbate-specific IIA component [Entomoplasma freundtii]